MRVDEHQTLEFDSFIIENEETQREEQLQQQKKKEKLCESFFSLVLPFSYSVCLHRKCEELSWALFNAHARIDVSEDIQNKKRREKRKSKSSRAHTNFTQTKTSRPLQ